MYAVGGQLASAADWRQKQQLKIEKHLGACIPTTTILPLYVSNRNVPLSRESCQSFGYGYFIKKVYFYLHLLTVCLLLFQNKKLC